MRRFAAVLLAVCTALVAQAPAVAQERPPRTGEDLAAFRDTLDVFQPQPFALRPFVLPGSERVFVSGALQDTSAYRIDYRRGRLWLAERPRTGDATLVVTYRTFPFTLRRVYRRRGIVDSAVVDTAGRRVVQEDTAAVAQDGFDPFAGITLQRSGSISRGLIAGSNRDVAVESGLRMQLAGEIAEGVSVRAVLTDENTPIQPEGTTQRLDDFDRVFIELAAPPGTARLGDVDLSFQNTAFARFDRKIQGAALSTAEDGLAVGGLGRVAATVAGATTRGVYRTQDIEVLDGVQGPYRLEGKDGERFIVVIAGSETVYLDGQPLERGETNDYVIDYAQAEITFTARRLLTDDRRVSVEFEYATTQFARTLLAGQGTAGLWRRDDGTARAEVGATFVREADSEAFGGPLGLSAEDSLRLAQAGDAGAFSSGAERVTFDPEARFVQYVREARAGPGGTVDTIFAALERAPPDSVPVFRVRFSRVDEGQGRYVRAGRAANGVLYEYRGPGEGRYEPVRRLPAPVQQRLVDLHGTVRPARGVELFGEWAQSLNDQNRLSALDAADDAGSAYLAGARLAAVPIEIGGARLGALSGTAQRRFRGRHFATFSRTRPVEFGRRWNLGQLTFDPTSGVPGAGDETVDEADLRFALTPRTAVAAEVGRLTLGEDFSSTRRQLALEAGEEGLPWLDYRGEYITSTDDANAIDGVWLRQRGSVEQPLLDGRLAPRVEVEQERRRQRATGTDSLTGDSFSFVELRPGVAFRSDAWTVAGEVEWRTEREAAGGTLRDAATAWTTQVDFMYNPKSAFQAQGRIGYRMRQFERFFRVNEQRQNTEAVVLQSRINAQPLGRAVEIDAFYEALTERTPTLQEVYVRTGPELGQYVWDDANGDGLTQVDEFVPEPTPNEGAYVRRFVPSDELEPVINVQARVRLRLDPGRRWRGAAAGWKRALSRVQSQTTVEIREKSRSEDLASIYLLDLSRFRDPATTQNGRLRVGQALGFFRRSTRYGVDLAYDRVESLSALAASTEQRSQQTWSAEGRWRPSGAWDLRVEGERETTAADSRFASRRYDIRSISVNPEASLRVSPAVQLTGGLAFAQKDDAVDTRQARVLKVPVEARLTLAQRLGLTARGEVARVDLDGGTAAGLAQFELTDGRGPGTSLLWSVSGQYRFGRYLRATLAYDGRAPAEAPVINTVRLGLSADF